MRPYPQKYGSGNRPRPIKNVIFNSKKAFFPKKSVHKRIQEKYVFFKERLAK